MLEERFKFRIRHRQQLTELDMKATVDSGSTQASCRTRLHRHVVPSSSCWNAAVEGTKRGQ